PFQISVIDNIGKPRLCDLPDEVLLPIMGQADNVTTLCLRRTSRVFFRLFKDSRFQHLHDNSRDMLPFRYLQPTPLTREKVPQDVMPALRSLLRKDLFCQNCREMDPEADIRLRTQFLYCSGCRAQHPAVLFSCRQRHYPSQKRICIGREGYVHICAHKVLQWDELEPWLSGKGPTYQEWKCTHPSHQYDSDNARCPEYCGKPYCRALLPKRKSSPEPTISIQSEIHMKVSGLGLTRAVDGEGVLRQIEWLRTRGAKKLYPTPRGKYPTELQFFDPNVCTCLYFDDPPPGWEVNQEEANTNGLCPGHKHPRGPVSGWGYSARMSKWRNNIPNKTSIAPCWRGHSLSRWLATVCETSPECIVVKYEKRLALGQCQQRKKEHGLGPVWPGWLAMIDPVSYGLREDEESYGIYWCDDEACHNFHSRGAGTLWKREMTSAVNPFERKNKSKLWKSSHRGRDLLANLMGAAKTGFRR
ncbi:hypothetical protein QBC47DRAFT_292954, partial [Echria macrotheca]